MPRATLILDADASALHRALGALPGHARRSQAAVTAETRKGAQERAAAARGEVTAAVAAARSLASVRREIERTTRAREANASRAAIALANREARASAQAARMLASDRLRAARDAQRAIERGEREQTRAHRREERERTKATRAESRERVRAERAAARELRSANTTIGRGIIGAAGIVASTGSSIHGDVQSARERRATPERLIGQAVYQGGGNRADANAATRRITQFAQAERMDPAQIAEALKAAQDEFSVLGDATTSASERETRMARFLETARLARDTGNDVGEMARVQGLIQSSGITDPRQQDTIMMHLAGMAQRGAVELGSVTREGMGAIRGRMAIAGERAQHAGGNAQAVQAAQADALRQSVAEMEVARLAGESPRAASNALRDVTVALGSTTTADNLRGNIANLRNREQRDRLTASLFEADPERRGEMRLRANRRNTVDFMEAFRDAGVDTETFMNLTRGGGQGNPMSLLSNQRRVLGQAFLGGDGAQNIRRLMDPSASLTQADRERGRDIFMNDTQAVLAGNQAEHDNKLTDNTNALIRMSNEINNLATRNPLETRGLEGGREAAGGLLGAGGIATRLGSGARGLLGRGAGLVSRLGGPLAAAFDILTTNSNARGVEEGGDLERRAMARTPEGARLRREMAERSRGIAANQGAGGDPVTVSLSPESAAAVGAHTAAALRNAPLTATVTPHAVAHAESGAPPRR